MTYLNFPKVIFGTSSLGNLYTALDDDTKLEIVSESIKYTEGQVIFDSAGKYGAGLALESLGQCLQQLKIDPSQVIISNKLGWLRTELITPEPTFEPGIWKGLKYDAVQRISYDGIMECYEQGNQLLNGYTPQMVSVHDPDEYLASAGSEQEEKQLYQNIIEAYRALSDLKAAGKVQSIGVGAKNWKVIERITGDVALDWVMIANSMTVRLHPDDLMDFMKKLAVANIRVINSAVFHSGFLIGGACYDYKPVDPGNNEHKLIIDWRETFFDLCRRHDVTAAEACVQFALKAPGVKSIALNTSNPKRVKENVAMAHVVIPLNFWRDMLDAPSSSRAIFTNKLFPNYKENTTAMKTLSCIKPGTLSYLSGELPVLKQNQAIIKIKRIGICGTDLHAFEGNQPYFNYPRILGHELAGELVDFDNAPGFVKGEAVTIIPYFNCNSCYACKKGNPNHCINIKVCGVHIDGGMVEYLAVPSSSLVHGNGLSFDQLALVEPLAIGAHGVVRAGVKKNEHVLVIGAGPIGLGTMELARIAGANVIAMDINDTRLQFCKEKLNIGQIVNAKSTQVAEQLMKFTNDEMPAVVIDATGNLGAINNAFQYMAHGARYVLIGLQKDNICFSHPEFHKREATLMSSRNALRSDFEHVITVLKNGWIDPLNYITHRVDFDEVKDAFDSWLDPKSGVIKAMISM